MAKRKFKAKSSIVRKYRSEIDKAASWERLEDIVVSIDNAFEQRAIGGEHVDRLCERVAKRAREIDRRKRRK